MKLNDEVIEIGLTVMAMNNLMAVKVSKTVSDAGKSHYC